MIDLLRKILPKRLDDKKSRFSVWRWKYIVDDEGRDYLTRLVLLKTPWFSVRLHWIHRADHVRDPHGHPWWFGAWVLRGNYLEFESEYDDKGHRLYERMKLVDRFQFNIKPMHRAHCIKEVAPNTVTLFVTGRWTDWWGFMVPTEQFDAHGRRRYDWIDSACYNSKRFQETA